MVVPLIVSALLLGVLGCMVPLLWVEDTKAFKVAALLFWLALVAMSILIRFLYPEELGAANPLLKVGLESICLVCAIYPAFGFASRLATYSDAQVDAIALLAFIELLVTVVGYICLLFGTIWLVFF